MYKENGVSVMIIYSGFIFLLACLLYKNRRDKLTLKRNLKYYSDRASELSGELKAQRELSALLAHDLKSPLAGIISSAQALELSGQDLPASYLDCLRLMQVSGRANLRLLSNFIDLIGKSSVSAETSPHTIPFNRKQLFHGLLETQMLADDERLHWKALPVSFKTRINIRQFSNALAEIIEALKSDKQLQSIQIEESFRKQSSELLIIISGLSKPEPQTEKIKTLHHYDVALRVIESLGVEIKTIDHLDSCAIEMSLPVQESTAGFDSQENEQQINANLLLELSLQQVQSATLSIGKLSELKRSKLQLDALLDQLNSDADLSEKTC